ncbi:MAG: dTDP-4-dehydrorhamnose 3,5-epimerase [Verrucomicrobia bacterium]|nr:dTDP-4-dehydrorhamnose 3,5-epimerase [Verrucomicrobiota bacterium]
MNISDLGIPGVRLIVPTRFSDARGFFQETWNDRLFREKIRDVAFVQDNRSVSMRTGTLHGLHLQRPPRTQGKLVRVVRGSIFDVVVDVRKPSATYARHVALTLDAESGAQLWIPPGFLHGFCTLEDQTEVLYKVTDYYNPSHEAGVLWNDPDLKIPWPFEAHSVILSAKDQQLPRLRDLPDLFSGDECAEQPGSS